MKTLIVAAADVAKIIVDVGLDRLMDDMIESLTLKLRDYDSSMVEAPTRSGFHYSKPEAGLLEWMPLMETGDSVTVKIVGYHPGNPDKYGVPTILSTVSAYDTTTGHLIGVADATFLTALRTAAASAVASKTLARPDSAIVGLIGCGAQAVSQLHAMIRTFPVRTVMVNDRVESRASTLVDRVADFATDEVEVYEAAVGEIVAESDILCTSTSVAIGEGPVFAVTNHQPWLHINAVGSDFPGKFELPLEMLRDAVVCPDFPDQAIKEGESQRLSREELGPSLAELVKDRNALAPLRDRLTVFDSTGWALTDHVALRLLLNHARRLGIGLSIDLETGSGDPYSPYHWAEDNSRSVPVTGG